MTEAMFEQLVVASANQKKANELHELLAASAVLSRVTVLPRPQDIPDVIEDAPDFIGNARLKAASVVAATALPAVADDSGLVVPFLNGQPGVRSARYCLEEDSEEFWLAQHPQVESSTARSEFVATVGHDSVNIERLLWELHNQNATSVQDRAATFVSTVVLQFPTWLIEQGFPQEIVATGEVPGHIIDERRGEQGFGYDPVFVPNLSLIDTLGELPPNVRSSIEGHTFAQMTSDLKAAMSHRGNALRALVAKLEAIL